MAIAINLGSPTSVGRSGASLSWTLPSGGNQAACSGFEPGSKAPYLVYQILPNQFANVPSPIDINPDTWTIADPSNAATVVADTIALGSSASPSNFASNQGGAVHSGSSPTWQVATTGFTLAELNAGSVYLWVGLSIPANGNLSDSLSGTTSVNGTVVVNWGPYTSPPAYTNDVGPGMASPGDATVVGTYTVSVSGAGATQASCQVVFTPRITSNAAGTPATYTSEISDSMGNSVGPTTGAVLLSLTTPVTLNIPLSGGSGSTTIQYTCTYTNMTGPGGAAFVYYQPTSVVFATPPANSVTIAQTAMSYSSGFGGFGGSGGGGIGAGGGGAEGTFGLGSPGGGLAVIPSCGVWPL